MELDRNPLINGLIQYTLLLENIIFLNLTRQNFFLLFTSHHNFLDFFFLNKKIGVRFLIGAPPRQAKKK
jgi:hypothetical protein